MAGGRLRPSCHREQRPSEPVAWEPRNGPGTPLQASSRTPSRPKRQPALALRPERRPLQPSKRRRTRRTPSSRGGTGHRHRAGGSQGSGARAARPQPLPPRAWSRRGEAETQPMQGGRVAARPRCSRRPCLHLTRGRPGPPPPSAPNTPPPSCLPPAPTLRRRTASGPSHATPTCPPVGRAGTPRPATDNDWAVWIQGRLSGDWFVLGPAPGVGTGRSLFRGGVLHRYGKRAWGIKAVVLTSVGVGVMAGGRGANCLVGTCAG